MYFRPYQYEIVPQKFEKSESSDSEPDECRHQEKAVLRQYKLFNDTILQTSSFINNDFVYATGVGGIIYKLQKRDLSKLMIKQKEKFKGLLVEKIVQITRDDGIEIKTAGIEDPGDERYLYSESDCTITNFQVSPDSCNGIGRLVPNAKKCENFEHINYYKQPCYLSFNLRNSEAIFVLEQQYLTAH